MPQRNITIAAGPTPAGSNMVHTGIGQPGHSAAKGTLYLRQDGSTSSTRAYSNSDGAATWVAVTTAS